MAEKEIKNEHITKGAALEPIMILVRDTQFKKVWDDKAKKFTDEIRKTAYKDSEKDKFVTIEMPPMKGSDGKDLGVAPTFFTVHENALLTPKKVTPQMKDNGMDTTNCHYVKILRTMAADGNSESHSVKGYQVTGKDKDGKDIRRYFDCTPSELQAAMPNYMSDAQKAKYKEKSGGKLPQRKMFKPRFVVKKAEKAQTVAADLTPAEVKKPKARKGGRGAKE